MKKYSLAFRVFFIALPYVVIIFFLLGEAIAKNKVDEINGKLETIEREKALLKTQKEFLLAEVDELYDLNDSLAERAGTIKEKVIKGKDRIKILSEKVIITDTLVIEYTEAMKGQIKDLEELVEVKDSTITNQEKIIVKKDSITANTEKTLALTEEQLEEVKKESKKKDRKITALKIQRFLYPAATAAGFMWFIFK
jgi:hypothetical protein